MTAAIRGYGPWILSYLCLLLRNDDDGYEVFAEVSEKLWKKIGTFRREGRFQSWIYRMAWTTAQDYLKATRRRRERRLHTTEVSKIAAQVRTETRRHGAPDRLARVRATLDPVEQTLLVLRYDRELGWDAISEIMETPAATLRKRFERLRARLARLLAEDQRES